MSKAAKADPLCHFSVRYIWADEDGEYEGHTVISSRDPGKALRSFMRRNSHLQEAWFSPQAGGPAWQEVTK